MSDIETLFYILAGLTLAFALVWVRPGGVLFVSHGGERHRLHWLAGRSMLRSGQGGFLFGNLTPFGSSFVAAPWPLAVSPTGVLAASATAPTPDGKPNDSDRFVAFADLKSAACDGPTLLLNGKPFLTCHSKPAARRWARRLIEWRDLAGHERPPAIERALTESCDAATAARAMEQCRRHTRWLRAVSTILFAYCFAILGIAAFGEWQFKFRDAIVGYAVLIALTFLLNWMGEAALTAANERSPGHKWMILISPIDAFRAADRLFRQPLEVFHPLALSRFLAGGAAFDNLARRVVRDIHYPLPDEAEPSADARAAETARWFAERMRKAILDMVSAAGIDPNRYLVPPQPEDLAVAYCPRCDGQFVRMAAACTACGVALRPFGE